MIIKREVVEEKSFEVKNISYNPDSRQFCIELIDERGNSLTATGSASAIIESFFEKPEDREGAGLFLSHITEYLANIAIGG